MPDAAQTNVDDGLAESDYDAVFRSVLAVKNFHPGPGLLARGISYISETAESAEKRGESMENVYELVKPTVAKVLDEHADVLAQAKAVEATIEGFAEGSKVLMKGLDAVGQIHPFVGVAILAFKAMIQLELTRRDNDKKVILLQTEMSDMMSVLLQLKNVKDTHKVDPDGTTLEGRMQELSKKTAKDIQACANTCETYMKKKFLVKLLKGPSWESKLAGFSDQFTKRRAEFEFALTMHTASGVDEANAALAGLQRAAGDAGDTGAMLLLFRQLDSPRERALMAFVTAHGGAAACTADETLFAEVLARSKELGCGDDAPDPETLRADLRADVGEAIAANRAVFDARFDAQMRALEELKGVVHREGDRVISAFNAGPHDRIVDPDLHIIWKDMAWRGHVEAKQFIIALGDYYAEKYGNESLLSDDDAEEEDDDGQKSQAPKRFRDQWALKYTSVAQARSILETFDDDASGFVSVKEANMFTSTRPHGWSVPRWAAFWSGGWPTSLSDYRFKIVRLIDKMHYMSKRVLPGNRLRVDQYLCSESTVALTYLTQEYSGPTGAPEMMEHVQEFVDLEEERMRTNLEGVGYKVDASETLALIAGPGRLEGHLFPLLYLLLRRHWRLFKLARKEIMYDDELYDAQTSINTVMDAVAQRVNQLIEIFKTQNLDPKLQFQQHACGMFKNVHLSQTRDPAFEEAERTDTHGLYMDGDKYWDSDDEIPDEVKILKYGVVENELDVRGYREPIPAVDASLLPLSKRWRPTEEQLQASPARARWGWACMTVLERMRRDAWSWSYFRARRDRRQRVLALFKYKMVWGNREMWGELQDHVNDVWEEAQTPFEVTLEPHDATYYESAAAYALRRANVHFNTNCEACNKPPVGALLICLDCKFEDIKFTMDLCTTCEEQDLRRDHPPNHHVPSQHNILKCPVIVHRRLKTSTMNCGHSAVDSARDIIAALASGTGVAPLCYHCAQPVSLPCWRCAECPLTETWICNACEVAEAASFSAQVPPVPPPTATKVRIPHHWSHARIRCRVLQKPPPAGAEVAGATLAALDERLSTHEERVREMNRALQEAVDARLSGIEAMLVQILGRLGCGEAHAASA